MSGARRASRVGFLVAVAVAMAGAVGTSHAAMRRERIDVGLCRLEAPVEAAPSLRALAAHAPEILAKVEADLGYRATRRYRFVLIPPGVSSDPEVRALDAMAPPWAAGFVLRGTRLGAIRVAEAARYPYGTLESVLAHEATHVLLQDAVPDGLPLWFEEGLATREGRRWSLEDLFAYSTALLTSDLPGLADLDADFHSSEGRARTAYAASFAFVSWATRHGGESFPATVVREAGRRPFEDAWRIASGSSLADGESRWRREALLRYRWITILTASSTLWIGVSLLALIAGMRRRAKARAARAAWEREESAGEDGGGDDAGGEPV